MTVGELIVMLEKCNPKLPVGFMDMNTEYSTFDFIDIQEFALIHGDDDDDRERIELR